MEKQKVALVTRPIAIMRQLGDETSHKRVDHPGNSPVGCSVQAPTGVINSHIGGNEMSKFEIYKDTAGYYRWRLVAGNGEKVAASEAYSSKTAAENSASKVAYWASSARIVHLV